MGKTMVIMMNREYGKYGAIALIVLMFALFVYPTLYKYDKLNQRFPVKINRITGTTEVLTPTGWEEMSKPDKPSISEMDSLRNELYATLQRDREQIKREIINEIKSQIIAEVSNDLKVVKEEITAYKQYELDPNNSFTLGSTKDEVKKIMGIPTSILDLYGEDIWYYGRSEVKFKNNKVVSWSDYQKNLRLK
jgi:hypothetical protein